MALSCRYPPLELIVSEVQKRGVEAKAVQDDSQRPSSCLVEVNDEGLIVHHLSRLVEGVGDFVLSLLVAVGLIHVVPTPDELRCCCEHGGTAPSVARLPGLGPVFQPYSQSCFSILFLLPQYIAPGRSPHPQCC